MGGPGSHGVPQLPDLATVVLYPMAKDQVEGSENRPAVVENAKTTQDTGNGIGLGQQPLESFLQLLGSDFQGFIDHVVAVVFRPVAVDDATLFFQLCKKRCTRQGRKNRSLQKVDFGFKSKFPY